MCPKWELLFTFLNAVSELAQLLTQSKVLSVGIHHKSGLIDMKLSRFIHILLINRHAQHICDEHGMTSQLLPGSDAAFHVDRTLRDSRGPDMLHGKFRQSKFLEFINIPSAFYHSFDKVL